MDPQTNIHPYLEEYNKFFTEYRRGMVSGEEVGEVIMRLAHYFSVHNIAMVEAERALSIVACNIENRTDETSGKAISSTKAKVITDATEESHKYNIARAHVQNIEAFINALKALQKGVLGEYANSSL